MTTGAKISYCARACAAGTYSKNVGAKKWPLEGASSAVCQQLRTSANPDSTIWRMRCNCTRSTIAPTSFDLSSGLPMRSLRMLARSLSPKRAAPLSCTRVRQRAQPGAQLVPEARGRACLQEDARAGAADLALVEPDGVDHAFDSGVEVG